MTVDDENSAYIGGLSYEASEESLRKALDFYGRVVAVKIVNDRATGGKCYGFVTFTNPRSAVNAISDMDGKRLDGRVIKVSEVKTRIGRSNFCRDSNFRRDSERGMDWERGRDREKDYGRDRFHDRLREERSVDRDQDRERGNDRTRDQERERLNNHTRDQERERLNNHTRDRTRSRDHFVDRDRGRDQGRDTKDIEPEHDKNHDMDRDRDWNSDRDQKREFEETKSHHRCGENDQDQLSKSVNGSEGNNHRSREPCQNQVMAITISIRGMHNWIFQLISLENFKKWFDFLTDSKLTKKISNPVSILYCILEMEELLEEKGEAISKLQDKSQDLEDALSMAKRLTSHRQLQLTKLHKCYLHMKDYSERLKTSEQELQSLVDSTMIEIEYDDNVGVRNGVLENGNAQHFQLV